MSRIIPYSKESALQKSLINLEILKWIKFVINFTNNVNNINPNIGDRYIIRTNDPLSELYVYNDYIFQWNGQLWEKIPPVTGWAVLVKELDDYYYYDSHDWKQIDNLIEHNDLNQLQGGTQNERYHLTKHEHDTLTQGYDASDLHNHDSRYQTPEINTNNFDSLLDASDDTIQKALDSLDDSLIDDPDMGILVNFK